MIPVGAWIERQQIEVLAHDAWVEPCEPSDLDWFGGDLCEEPDGLEVPDVAVDGLPGVPGLPGDPGRVVSLEVEGDDFTLPPPGWTRSGVSTTRH